MTPGRKPSISTSACGCQRQQRLLAVRILQIQPADRLAGIQRGMEQRRSIGVAWTKLHHAVALRRFDLQHVRTEIGQQQTGERTRQVAGQVEHAHATQAMIEPRHASASRREQHAPRRRTGLHQRQRLAARASAKHGPSMARMSPCRSNCRLSRSSSRVVLVALSIEMPLRKSCAGLNGTNSPFS